MIIVNIETYGDFDMPSTDTLMVAPDFMTKKGARTLADEASAKFANTNDSAEVIKFFKDQGFTPAIELKCTIGGNL